MRPVTWTLPVYGLSVTTVVVTLLTGHLPAARVLALAPFGVLAFAVAAAGHRQGRAFAVAGLISAAALVTGLATTSGDWIADAGLVLASFTLAVALLRAGGSRALRRWRPLANTFAVVWAVLIVFAAVVLVAELPQDLHPVPGCVDTCFGAGLLVLFSSIVITELALLAMTVAAAATGWIVGLGALIVSVSANTLFVVATASSVAPPSSAASSTATAGWYLALVGWYLGLLLLVRPWTRRESAAYLSLADRTIRSPKGST